MEVRHRSLTHRALWAREGDARCDVCDAVVDADDALPALYVFTRGEERRYEEPPVCARCAHALGAAQLRRWQVEDDEG